MTRAVAMALLTLAIALMIWGRLWPHPFAAPVQTERSSGHGAVVPADKLASVA
jgi:hypothetical protein